MVNMNPDLNHHAKTLASGDILVFNYLPLGAYDAEQDALVVHQIAAIHSEKAEGNLDLGDGHYFSIDSLLNEQERRLSGKEKSKWVSSRTKKIFECYKQAKIYQSLVIETNGHTSS